MPRIAPMYSTTLAPSKQTFTRFPSLPPELRAMIWYFSLARERIIPIRIASRKWMDEQFNGGKSARPPTHAHGDYDVIFNGFRNLSELFRVSREARYTAMLFYRVQIPGWITSCIKHFHYRQPFTFYMNPEHDFIHIDYEETDGRDGVFKFVTDLKTVYDHRGEGLVNLVIDYPSLSGLLRPQSAGPSSLSPFIKAKFGESLHEVREVFFIHVLRGDRTHCLPDEVWSDSFPSSGIAPHFHRLRHQLNLDDPDLENDLHNGLPREMRRMWKRLLRENLGDKADLVSEWTKYRVLVAEPPGLVANDARYVRKWVDKVRNYMVKRRPYLWCFHKEDKSPLVFWLFPIHAYCNHRGQENRKHMCELALMGVY